MADKMEITSPVKVESNDKERVAFDLACKIDDHSGLKFEQKDRQYWLTLYWQCLKATKGYKLQDILQPE